MTKKISIFLTMASELSSARLEVVELKKSDDQLQGLLVTKLARPAFIHTTDKDHPTLIFTLLHDSKWPTHLPL